MYFKKIKLMSKRVGIVNCCVNGQHVIYVTICVELSVSDECCIRYCVVVVLAINKKNEYRLSEVLHESMI